jgi:hypothetical protein
VSNNAPHPSDAPGPSQPQNAAPQNVTPQNAAPGTAKPEPLFTKPMMESITASQDPPPKNSMIILTDQGEPPRRPKT